MNDFSYQPTPVNNEIDMLIAACSGPEPDFDQVMQDFLRECYRELVQRCQRGGLLEFASLGQTHPWLYRLTFQTRGLTQSEDGEITTIDRHVLALRFLPDFLRNANQFAMLRLVEPMRGIFHPNISVDNAVCLQVHPGATVVEICHSLHDLFRWRLRQYDERDALNPAACAWGRANIESPIDDRPLFGKSLNTLQWQDTSHS